MYSSIQNLKLMSYFSALCASQWYVIPSFPEPDSYDGFLDLVAECEEIHGNE